MTTASLSVAFLLLLALTTSFFAPAAANRAHAAAAREGYTAAGVVGRKVSDPPRSCDRCLRQGSRPIGR